MKQRADAEKVADQIGPLLPLVHQTESEHAGEFRQAGDAQLFVQMNQHLAITTRPETMPVVEPMTRAQLAEIGDLAVVCDDDRTVFVGHRQGGAV